ncbi:MAG: lysophospholipid acyltransferase family protein [Cytophagales bacterium]|nr:lysophospholipid acyltransferase family protein [Cytophagales bacterium]MDW8383981.1 lysophospholipid acyltransferase family protein [Flammeovirgaceae bacterium]
MILVRAFSLLPLWILYRFSDLLYILMEYVIKYRRKVIDENLKRSFPNKSQQERCIIRKEFYRNLADILVETLKAFTISEKELTKRVVFLNIEELMFHNHQKESVIGICGHNGNWEWLLLASSIVCRPYTIKGLYKKIQNPFFEKLMYAIRSRFGAQPVELDQVREILRNRHEPMLIAMVADQIPGANELHYWTSFLGQDTAFYEGVARVAKLRKAQVFFLGMKRLKRGYYRVKVEKIVSPENIQNSGSVIELYRDKLEALIHEQPSNWLWSHRRWKHQRIAVGK